MKKQQKTLALWIVVILAFAFIAKVFDKKAPIAKSINYSEFINSVEQDRVQEVTFQGTNTIQGKFVDGYEQGKHFELTGNTGDETFKILRTKGIIPNYKKEEKHLFQIQLEHRLESFLVLLYWNK